MNDGEEGPNDGTAPATRSGGVSESAGGSSPSPPLKRIALVALALAVPLTLVVAVFVVSLPTTSCACSPPPPFVADYDHEDGALEIQRGYETVQAGEDQTVVVNVSGRDPVVWGTQVEEDDALSVSAGPGDVVTVERVGPEGREVLFAVWLRPSVAFTHDDGTVTVRADGVRSLDRMYSLDERRADRLTNVTVFVDGERRTTVPHDQWEAGVTVRADPGDTVRLEPLDEVWAVPGNESRADPPSPTDG